MEEDKNIKIKKIFKMIYKVVSYTIICILMFIASFLIFYVISGKIAKKQGKKPLFGLYTIISPSMEPNVRVYDVVVDLNIFSEKSIKEGDIITFISNSNVSKGLTVTHRVVKVITNADGTKSYLTKGDNNLKVDQSPVNYDDILGKVLFKIPQLGRIQFLIADKFGWILVVLLPALGVIIYDFIKLFRLLAFNSKFMRLGAYNKKIETEIDVDDLNQLRTGLSTVKKFYKRDNKEEYR